MFVRWQARQRNSRAFGRGRTDTHWAAILAESSRVDGKPTQHHIAYLGGITDSSIKIAARRAFFWRDAVRELNQLANWISSNDRARIEEAVAAKVPRLTRSEYNECVSRRAALGIEPGSELDSLPGFQVCDVPVLARQGSATANPAQQHSETLNDS